MQPFRNATSAQIRKALQNATRLVGNDAVVHFKGNFLRQGFDGQNWQEVKRRIPGTKAYKYPKKRDKNRRTRAILFGKGSGRLHRSIRVTRVMDLAVAIGTDVPYAQVHNEGGRHIPKRAFMGMDQDLQKKITSRIDTAMDSVFRRQ